MGPASTLSKDSAATSDEDATARVDLTNRLECHLVPSSSGLAPETEYNITVHVKGALHSTRHPRGGVSKSHLYSVHLSGFG